MITSATLENAQLERRSGDTYGDVVYPDVLQIVAKAKDGEVLGIKHYFSCDSIAICHEEAEFILEECKKIRRG